MSEIKNENKQSRGLLNKILLCVFSVSFVISTALFFRGLYVKHQQQKLYEELAAQMGKIEVETIVTESEYSETETMPKETETESETELSSELDEALGEETAQRELDWEALQKENEDIYAWIYIPDTNVDYPILQHPTDPSYYLRRGLNGKKSTAGCIYTQYYNSKDFRDPNTVIYGHNMRNQSMFATLHNFEDNVFFEEHPYVYIYTPEETLVYHVFAAYEFSNAHVLLSFDFNTPECFELYLESVRSIKEMNSHMRDEVVVTAEDHIITLSTCVTGKDDRRWLVQAVLLNDLEETTEVE